MTERKTEESQLLCLSAGANGWGSCSLGTLALPAPFLQSWPPLLLGEVSPRRAGPGEGHRRRARQPHVGEVSSSQVLLCPMEINRWSFCGRNCSRLHSPRREGCFQPGLRSHRRRLSPGASPCAIAPSRGVLGTPLSSTGHGCCSEIHTQSRWHGEAVLVGRPPTGSAGPSWKPRVSGCRPEVQCVSQAWPSVRSARGAFVL